MIAILLSLNINDCVESAANTRPISGILRFVIGIYERQAR